VPRASLDKCPVISAAFVRLLIQKNYGDYKYQNDKHTREIEEKDDSVVSKIEN